MNNQKRVSLYYKAVDDTLAELIAARKLFDPMQSAHEGYAVLLEEVDELWEEIRNNKGEASAYKEAMRKEAIQVAAMAIAFIVEVCYEERDGK